jgi:YebC/PmpR family DNA-binding regulatory protein
MRKGRQDAQRSKIFSKLSREVIVAAREGGGNPDLNVRLRTAIQAARDGSMPVDTIEKAIKRGTGDLEGVSFEEVTYEGYGPAGVALLLHVLTDNSNRAVAELRNIMRKCGGSLGEAGCVAWMFEQKGSIVIEKSGVDEEQLMEIALEAGADDLQEQDGTFEVTCEPAALQELRDRIEGSGLQPMSAQVTMVPHTVTEVDGEDAERILQLMTELEEHDDVQRVYANFDIPDEIIARHAEQ